MFYLEGFLVFLWEPLAYNLNVLTIAGTLLYFTGKSVHVHVYVLNTSTK